MNKKVSSAHPCVLHSNFTLSSHLHLASKIIAPSQIYQLNFPSPQYILPVLPTSHIYYIENNYMWWQVKTMKVLTKKLTAPSGYFLPYDVLLTVHRSTVLVINQINAKILFYNKFIICLYMFRTLCAHHQKVKIVSCSIWFHHTCRWPSCAQVERWLLSQPVHRTATYKYDYTRCCMIQFWPPDDEHIVLETCRGI